MANYSNLDSYIIARVYENANNEISGQDMQDVLLQIVQDMGKSGYICQGVATTSTTPPVSSDSNIFYFAEGAGTYTNFGGLVVGVGELALFFWNGSTWDKESCNIVEIIDNLTTNDSTKALSAKQGKVLNDALQALRQTLDSMDILDNVAGSAVGLLNPIAENAEFTFRESGAKGDGAALINSIKGKTLAWNQLLDIVSISGSVNGIDYSINNGLITLNGTATAITAIAISVNSVGIPVGHKVLFRISQNFNFGANSLILHNGWEISADLSVGSVIVESNSAVPGYWILRIDEGVSFTNDSFYLGISDLTLLEIDNLTTVEEVEAWLATNVGLRSYYPFNAGELKSNDAQSIVTVGRNQWDEVITLNKMIDASTGAIFGAGGWFISANYIPVFPNTQYCFRIPVEYGTRRIAFYDVGYNFIKSDGWYGVDSDYEVITTPSEARYCLFEGQGAVYNHDICINLSDASFNGQYEPYWKNTLELNIKTLTGKKDGQGASVTIFPDGAGGAGSVYDELRKSVAYKRFGIVDLGDLDWTYSEHITGGNSDKSGFYANNPNGILLGPNNIAPIALCGRYLVDSINNLYDGADKKLSYSSSFSLRISDSGAGTDAATFKAAMAGVKLVYLLATPETYVLDTPLKMNYKVAKGGTEERVSPNSDGISAPMVEEVQYPMQTKGDAGYDISVTDGNPATINLTLPIDATGAVFLTCGGATFSALISAGQATLSISGIASGTYTFVAMYSGDEKYAPFSVSDTVTIS